jgi:signal transduction histidine kinase
LELTEQKTRILAGTHSASAQLNLGLPLFYEQLISVLEKKLSSMPPADMLKTAASHGKEFLSLGYSLSHVVHAYGAMCQAITELAIDKQAQITAVEFNILNGCLDVAIASAVSEYQFRSNEKTDDREIKHLGFLAHELRNALSSATVAHEMIKAGLVGTGGSTANVLEANLSRMRHLIDRSLSEVRMRADADVFVEKFSLSELIDQIVVTAQIDAKKKNQSILPEGDWKIEIEADRQFILSAIANLVQNAIKYTKSGGKILIKTSSIGNKVLVEVGDQCGGIDTEKISAFFEPYVQGNIDKSGLGLGLAIAQRAILLSHGTITVKNNPGFGCTFIIEIPKKIVAGPSTKPAVRGEDSVQPAFRKRT